ncbi:uncharacterized protein LOC122367029 [Amphibalanus amphitrite]|uniref:uncharacterized protein LOC122367029 n=1 Tax=Amphibalanus amphitrite TaxID=1232801 RepID=UPI001C8FCDD1|nr:uncharacterized protein LOC122367029 [Amphibalanus amphitrite]
MARVPPSLGTVLTSLLLVLVTVMVMAAPAMAAPRSLPDQSIRSYISQRACWWNELCKEEFQPMFKCRCPKFSYCRSPGKYYNARCAMSSTGYIWMQPETRWSLLS